MKHSPSDRRKVAGNRTAQNARGMRVGRAAVSGGAGRSAHVMKPQYLALIENFRLMDDNSEEGRHAMCKAVEELVEREKVEAKAEGERKTMLATAKRMLKDGILALKDIARYSGLSLAQVKKLQASMA